MALGDYTPTAWVNGTAPEINATNLGHIETKVDEVDAWAATATPAGAMTMYAGASIPTGWLLCDGQAVSRTTYAALFTAVSTTWGIGNGTTTFNVPDMRESAPVGVGTFSAVIGTTHAAQASAETYTLGQFKDDQFQGHNRYVRFNTLGNYVTTASINTGASFTSWIYSPTSNNEAITKEYLAEGANGTPRPGTVTRGKRIGLNFIIKT